MSGGVDQSELKAAETDAADAIKAFDIILANQYGDGRAVHLAQAGRSLAQAILHLVEALHG